MRVKSHKRAACSQRTPLLHQQEEEEEEEEEEEQPKFLDDGEAVQSLRFLLQCILGYESSLVDL
ncbi:hypothetical protein EYF80_030366 [Liparis tanakae]|uniref:Uncharacterized protein n=1 Tax=Liparis tanakae TaxID=230148 RepID=A0A4Z2H1K0_9TELE|nr:hypothetical protein EYF80_030366 [Liparis tanakae]